MAAALACAAPAMAATVYSNDWDSPSSTVPGVTSVFTAAGDGSGEDGGRGCGPV